MSLLEKALEQAKEDRKRDKPHSRVNKLPGVRPGPAAPALRRIYAGYGVLGVIILLLIGTIIYREPGGGRAAQVRSTADIAIRLPVPAPISIEPENPPPAVPLAARPYPGSRLAAAGSAAPDGDSSDEPAWDDPDAGDVPEEPLWGQSQGGREEDFPPDEADEPYAQEDERFAVSEDAAGAPLPDRRLSAQAMNNAGLLYLEQGDLKEARRFLEEALRLDPGSEKILNNLGLSYYLEGSYPEAIQYYEMALEINPDNVETYGNLGLTYRKKGLSARAEQMFQKALALDRYHPEVLYNYGLLLAAGGRSRAARDTLEQFVRIAPERLHEKVQKVKKYLAAAPTRVQ